MDNDDAKACETRDRSVPAELDAHGVAKAEGGRGEWWLSNAVELVFDGMWCLFDF